MKPRGELGLTVLLAILLAGCGAQDQPEPTPDEEPPAIEVTRWTDRTELFMEHPPLVAGAEAVFVVHLTDLVTFLPVTEGRVGVRVDGATPEEFWRDSPSRPGIFLVPVTVAAPGEYQLTVALRGPLADEHRVGPVTVYPDATTAAAAVEEEDEEGATPFLKEQQWVLDFATMRIEERPLRHTIVVPAEIEPRTGGVVDVRATAAGRVVAGGGHPIGSTVRQGDRLLEIVARSARAGERPVMALELEQAKVALALAREDRRRIERLVDVGAVPRRRLAETQAAEQIAAAHVERLEQELRRLDFTRTGEGEGRPDDRMLVRAPISGIVAESQVVPGATVAEDDLLVRLVATDRVHVVGAVPEHQLGRLSDVTGAEVVVPGMPAAVPATRLVSIGRLVDHDTRTVPVRFELVAPPPSLAIGQAVSLRLLLSDERVGVAVPRDAIVDDGGQPVVFVQVGGERFERRPVQLGDVSEGGLVQIRDGLSPGERVVSRGAHLVRLAALSPQAPAHGHVH